VANIDRDGEAAGCGVTRFDRFAQGCAKSCSSATMPSPVMRTPPSLPTTSLTTSTSKSTRSTVISKSSLSSAAARSMSRAAASHCWLRVLYSLPMSPRWMLELTIVTARSLGMATGWFSC